ncbi:MAG TPA: ABC transporter permease [Alphaproteobacteria bacterium]|nr:ABC transporter permease [Alphaproteobacteria bacterium]
MSFFLQSFLVSVIAASTPLLLAATGELVAEKSGVLNLGVEGMMLVGAIAGFATAHSTGNPFLGVIAAIFAGGAMALIFGFLTLTMLANQIATGLALTIFGRGFSALMGAGFVGIAAPTLPKLKVPLLTELPFIGPVLFGHDILIYFSFVALAATGWFLYRTHAGLILRAVGDSHDAAHAIGYPVIRIRYAAAMFGGAMAGLAGAYMSLSYSPLWAEDMTAGRGWIALALVVFSAWRPAWLLGGAYLFGGIMYLSLYVQGLGVPIPSPFVSSLPYLGTVLVLVIISRDRRRIRLNQPASLGRPFHATA